MRKLSQEELQERSKAPERDPELAHGRGATSPFHYGRKAWWDIIRRVYDELEHDKVALVSGGVAFFFTLSLLPAMVALISLYGLMFSAEDVAAQVENLIVILPPNASQLMREQAQTYIAEMESGSGWGVFFGIVGTVVSASGGAKTLLDAINIAYDEKERAFFIQRAIALAFALGGLILTLLTLFLIGLTPLLLDWAGLEGLARLSVGVARWFALSLIFMVGIVVIYRLAPARRQARLRWVGPGAAVATILWLLASRALAFYAEHMGGFGATYGSLGGLFALMLWLYLTAFVVLLGAELNAELEAQTIKDSTIGHARELGARGAVKADELGQSSSGSTSVREL